MKRSEPDNQKETSLDRLILSGLIQTSEHLTASFSAVLDSYGLTFTQYSALLVLSNSEHSGLSCSEIGDSMLSRFSDITRLMDRLQNKGYVIRTRDKKDRRTVRTKISDKGSSLIRKLEKPVKQWERKTLDTLNQDQKKTLLELVKRIRSECS